MTGIEFLKKYFSGTERDIEIRSFQGESTRRIFSRDWGVLKEAIERDLKSRYDVYFGCTTRQHVLDKGTQKMELRGKAENAAEIVSLWCDQDFKDIPETEAQKKIDAFPIRPSVIINSGGGFHLHWFLNEPHDAQDATVVPILRGIAITLGGDLQPAEIARVLRVPGTKNFKPDYPTPRDVKIVDDNSDERYEFIQFAQFAAVAPPLTAVIASDKPIGIPIPAGVNFRDALATKLNFQIKKEAMA